MRKAVKPRGTWTCPLCVTCIGPLKNLHPLWVCPCRFLVVLVDPGTGEIRELRMQRRVNGRMVYLTRRGDDLYLSGAFADGWGAFFITSDEERFVRDFMSAALVSSVMTA